MPDNILQIAEGLKYRKIARLRELKSESQYEIMNYALKNSIRGTYAILFFPASMIQITPYGFGYSAKLSKGTKQHYLTMFPELKAEYFREVFTSIEMLLFKICHIFLEQSKPAYKFESQKTFIRLKRIETLMPAISWREFKEKFSEIWFVRDAFAHSFIDLENILYRGVPLNECFGSTYLGRSYDDWNFTFVEDLETVFDPIILLFIQRQFEQIDSDKFTALCDAELSPRSLGR